MLKHAISIILLKLQSYLVFANEIELNIPDDIILVPERKFVLLLILLIHIDR